MITIKRRTFIGSEFTTTLHLFVSSVLAGATLEQHVLLQLQGLFHRNNKIHLPYFDVISLNATKYTT